MGLIVSIFKIKRKGVGRMKTKLNLGLQVDDDKGNTDKLVIVDVYITTSGKQELELLKDGLQSLCMGMHDIINEIGGN